MVADLLASVQKHVTGVGIRPATDVFGDTKSDMRGKILFGGGVLCMVGLNKNDKFVYSGREEDVMRKHDLSS